MKKTLQPIQEARALHVAPARQKKISTTWDESTQPSEQTPYNIMSETSSIEYNQ